jgi:hypothetical protein
MRRHEGFGFEDICRGNLYFPEPQYLEAHSITSASYALRYSGRQRPVIESSEPDIEQTVVVIVENTLANNARSRLPQASRDVNAVSGAVIGSRPIHMTISIA